ncbi:exopolysaccharide transport family protein [Niabella ginsengisoli]|uniref:Wzz/FepE/Etk N-terminal domain-containing protein n=1 Tax=Niabella ginsengisoli TaxID=522298 RepID=A0ABS9SHS1_9BACT|nr:Wzz/FepE/Etk N-terminal domain-containing protein [Niabella ginsengisoli]MCH5597902.1 Wzz/FepE/Etk N-terminal domain-containing protein [Niabella ginsengisoli]
MINLNLKDFLKYISRFKWLLIIVPIVFAVITYFMAKTLPKTYTSTSLISTGLANRFQQSALGNGGQMDYFQLSQQFGNILERMRSKRSINTLSYKLILHDLENPSEAFKEPSKLVTELSDEDKQLAITEYNNRLAAGQLISTADNGNRIKLFDMLTAAGYDEKSILNNLSISRSGESDFIQVVYSSPNSNLSAYVVNTFSSDFISYYNGLSIAGQRKSLAILDTILQGKQSEMERKSADARRTLEGEAAKSAGQANSQRQSEMAYSRYSEAEAQRLQYIRQISSIKGNLAEVNAKLSGKGGYVNQSQSRENIDIVNIDAQLKIANQRYINNNFRAQDRQTVDSLQRIKDRLIERSANNVGSNSAAIRQDLIAERLKLEGDLASAQSALATVEDQLRSLPKPSGVSAATTSIAPEGVLRDAENASTEYEQAQNQYTQTELAAKTSANLTLAEPGLPGPPEKSKTILFVGFSGISSFLLCLMTLFLTFALNKNIEDKARLERVTKQKVLGCLNNISEEDKDLRNIWKDDNNVKNYTAYKDLLRSLRFEINQNLSEQNNVLGITSMKDGDGKTFLAGSLSYAFAMMGKNVLLICEKDGNILDLVTNTSEGQSTKQQKFESFLVKKQIQVEDRITILNRNTSNNNSLLELRDTKSLIAGFEVLKNTFDIVIIDIHSGEDLHNVKEWLMFCDRSIAVYEAGSKFSEQGTPFINYLSTQPGFLGWVLNKVKIA